MLLLVLQFVLVVADAKAERKEVVGVLGSSVLLDPEITVDPSKNEILWTFKASNKSDDVIVDHIPGVATLEPSEQFKDRLQFNAANGALTINRLEASDEGNYTYSVDSKELKIIQLLVIDKMKEVIGILGSSVLLDPKIKVVPNKNEILWTFIASNKSLEVVLDHIPGLTMEPSEQFKNRLQFFASSGGLMINSLKSSDQGDYIFTVDGRELKVIQLFLHDKMKEVIGILNSSILLDPGLRVDPSKNEIVWTFFGNSILHHVPDHTITEHSEQFKSRLEFSNSNGALTINGLTPRDGGSYSFIVNEEEMKILELLIYEKLSEASIFVGYYKFLGFTVQLTCDVSGDPDERQWQKDGEEISQRYQLIDENMTLVIQRALVSDCGSYTCVAKNPISSIRGDHSIILHGLSNIDAIAVIVLTAGLVISSASLHPVMLLDDWRLETQGVLGIAFHFLSIAVSHILANVTFISVSIYWAVVRGVSPLDIFTSGALSTGLLLSVTYISTSVYLPGDRTSQREIYWSTGKVLVQLSTKITWIVTVLFIILCVFALVSAFLTKDNAAVVLTITGLVLPLMLLVPLMYLLLKLRSNRDRALRFRRWLPIYSVIFLFVTFITMVSWMVITGLTREDILMVTMSVIGLVPYAGYAITFLFWTWKVFPGIGDKRWGWCLNICNVVSLVCILITFICWIVFKGEHCISDIPTRIILITLMPGCVITLLRTFLIWHRKCKGSNTDNCAEEQGNREMNELQTMNLRLEAESR
ncbi:uncharacterized protein [Mobula birostris]|uniref:uncharacterized protein isoform X2 n=1 Tax=Mobula birostris TaxID=1983395 RepID=UPI003B2870EB